MFRTQFISSKQRGYTTVSVVAITISIVHNNKLQKAVHRLLSFSEWAGCDHNNCIIDYPLILVFSHSLTNCRNASGGYQWNTLSAWVEFMYRKQNVNMEIMHTYYI